MYEAGRKKALSILLILMVLLSAMTCGIGTSYVKAFNDDRRSVVNGRDDGKWLFPLDRSLFSLSDWAGCNQANGCVCPFGCGCHITCSEAHNNHNGIDIPATNQPVKAAASGTAYWAGYQLSGRGNTLVIEHEIDRYYSYYSYYQHLSPQAIKTGPVNAGDTVAVTGDTGSSGQYHLHFGIVLGQPGRGADVANGTYLNTLESKGETNGWITSPGLREGRIVTNPSIKQTYFSCGYFDTTYASGSLSARLHCGSVTYVFNSNEVSVYSPDTTPPTISNLAIVEQNTNGYQVRCNVSDNIGVTSVRFVTWTLANGQDDLREQYESVSNNSSEAWIARSDHNNESGTYVTDVYAYDAAGNESDFSRIDVTFADLGSSPEVSTDYNIYPANSTVTLKWSSVENASSYSIDGYCHYANGTVLRFINQNVGDVTSFAMTLSDSGLYDIYVYANGSYGNSTYSHCTFSVKEITSTPVCLKSCTLDGHNYTAYLSTKTWDEAKAWCESNGGYLATVTSKSERTGLAYMTREFSAPHFFLGGYQDGNDWKWITDEAFSYSNWGEGQPDQAQEKWLAAWTDTGKWNNVRKNEPTVYGFIFESGSTEFVSQETESKPMISAKAYVLNKGWTSQLNDGSIIGSAPSDLISANRISGISMQLENCSGDSSINYSVHLSNIGWNTSVANGAIAGVTDEAEGVEAVKISLSGNVASKYSVFYQTFVFSKGWTPWAKDEEISGSIGGGFPITAIRIMLVPKITYRAHIEEEGWMNYVGQGETAGTTGQGLRMESFAIELSDYSYGNVVYRAHIAEIGWGQNCYNGASAGTTNLSLQAEAFQVELEGTAAEKYDVLYRAHVAERGWLEWQRNGTMAGTSGEKLQMEAIQTMLVPKGYQISNEPTYQTYHGSTYLTVAFNCNGGTCDAGSKRVIFGSTYGSLPIPTREGYVFLGWSLLDGTEITPTERLSTPSGRRYIL